MKTESSTSTERWVIVEKDKGIFLGSYTPEDIGKSFSELADGYYNGSGEAPARALFANDNIFGLDRCCSFASQAEAHFYLSHFFKGSSGRFKFKVIKIESEDAYPHVVDLIKAGLSEYTFEMTDLLFAEAKTLH